MMTIYQNTDDIITIDVAALNMPLGTKIWFMVKLDYDNDVNDATAVISKTVATTVVNQTTVSIVIDSDEDYTNIIYNKVYKVGILYQTPVASPNDKWSALPLSDSDEIFFKKTVQNTRPNYP